MHPNTVQESTLLRLRIDVAHADYVCHAHPLCVTSSSLSRPLLTWKNRRFFDDHGIRIYLQGQLPRRFLTLKSVIIRAGSSYHRPRHIIQSPHVTDRQFVIPIVRRHAVRETSDLTVIRDPDRTFTIQLGLVLVQNISQSDVPFHQLTRGVCRMSIHHIHVTKKLFNMFDVTSND